MTKKTRKRPAEAKKSKARYGCSVCGLMITVDELCGCVDTCDIVCCGEQMTPKK